MAASLRDLRRKIKSITSTQKITSAMQLVAASKMQRATKRAVDSRVYTDQIAAIIKAVRGVADHSDQLLFQEQEERQVLVVLLTTNRGLAGSLNTQLLREFSLWRAQRAKRGQRVMVVAVGNKGRQYLVRFMKESLVADFGAPEAVPTFTDATPIARLLIDEFSDQRTNAVYLAYNHFVSTLRQEPRIVRFLPFGIRNQDKEPLPPTTYPAAAGPRQGGGTLQPEVLFEPSREALLAALVPRALRAHLYQVLLEGHASEQSARMVAMKNATDNAGDLLDDLTLTYNGVRQAAITGELLDIAAGASALEAR